MLIKIPAWPGQPRLPGLLECHKKPLLLLSLKDLLKDPIGELTLFVMQNSMRLVA